MQASQNHSYKSIVLGFALVWLLTGVYLFFYSGIRVSNDEIYLFDSTESFARRGNLQLNYTYNLQPLLNNDYQPERDGLYEPLQPILAAPLFLIGQIFQSIGMMHTVWMFNIFVTVLTALLLYRIGLSWNYSPVVSALTALLYGVGTLAFPYNSTFFREPLATLFTLTAFSAALRLHQMWIQGTLKSARRWIIILLVALVGIALTKSSTLVVLPSLLILLMPSPSNLLNWLRRPIGLGVVGVVVFLGVAGLLFIRSDLVPTRFSYVYIVSRLENTQWDNLLDSLLGYQVSFGRSLWLYSPILLAGFADFWIKRHDYGRRIFFALLLALILFPLSFGVVHQQLWWSGTGWGPRYLLPLIPILMLGVFPVLERLRTMKFGAWHGGFALLALVSVAIQLVGMLVFVADYYTKLSDAGIIVWEDGLWTWEWSPIRQNLLLLDVNNLNVAWMQANVAPLSGLLAMLMTMMLIVGGLGLWFWRGKRVPSPAVLTLVTLVVVISGIGLRLRSIYNDPRYGSDDLETMQMIDQLDAVTTSDDVIFIQNSEIALAFMNTFKTPALVLTLPNAPGERHNPDVPPEIVSDNLVDLMSLPTAILVDYEIARHENAWLVMPYGPFNMFTIRPTERYMVENYYPVQEIAPSQRARAIRFVDADSITENDWQAQQSYIFGEQLELTGATLPDGTVFTTGDVIPLALVWQPIVDMERDYTVSVQLGDVETMVPVVQRDTTPQGQFGYTARWNVGETYVDHHGLLLPEHIPSGTYCLNVIIYYWEDGSRLSVQAEDGASLGDVFCLTEITID